MKNQNIVLCAIGDVRTPKWLTTKMRDYDICLVYYGDDPVFEKRWRGLADHFLKSPGFKMPNYRKALDQFGFLKNYDYFIFIDDDLIFNPAILAKCFHRAREYGLDACQPSTSYYGRRIHLDLVKKPGVFMEYTDFIECNFMCLSKRSLEVLLGYWDIFYTGWGFDCILKYLIKGEDKIAVFHDVSFYNPRKMGLKRSAIRRSDNNPHQYESIKKKLEELFGITEHPPRVRIYNSIQSRRGKTLAGFINIEDAVFFIYKLQDGISFGAYTVLAALKSIFPNRSSENHP